MSMCIQGKSYRDMAAWTTQGNLGNQPVVFVWGHPRMASDAEFEPETRIETIHQSQSPGTICRLYERYGTAAFGLLEGNFSLVLMDSGASTVYLVVDKFGCEDIYCYRDSGHLSFSSHPGYLCGANFKFNGCAVAFYLAQEGFIPAPFTLFDGIETIGRARFLRIRCDEHAMTISCERYWKASRFNRPHNGRNATASLYPLLQSAVRVRQNELSGLLLSGGVDSSLLFDIALQNPDRSVMAMTGSVMGYEDGESEIRSARALTDAAGVPHESVIVDPHDETLPDEWDLLTESWLAGSRTTSTVFYRLAHRARRMLGEGEPVISGQMADTLADNNYTNPSFGYKFRRAFYSPVFLRLLPLMKSLAPQNEGAIGNLLRAVTKRLCGPRIAEMVRSVLCGIADSQTFYDGRVFGYGEMPGRSSAYFPSLTKNGFARVADWYSTRFVAPIVSRLSPTTFYSDMFELSLDMVMLHLDTRLVCHAFSLEGMRAELPFLDTRVVNYFFSLPNSARSLLREPKHVVRSQVRRHKSRPSRIRGTTPGTAMGKSADELLLSGSIGAHCRDLLNDPGVLNQVHGIFEYVDERYAFEQIRGFKKCETSVSVKFISRLAALEKWSRLIVADPCTSCEWAKA